MEKTSVRIQLFQKTFVNFFQKIFMVGGGQKRAQSLLPIPKKRE